MNNNYLNNSNFGGAPLYSNGTMSPNQTTAPTTITIDKITTREFMLPPYL